MNKFNFLKRVLFFFVGIVMIGFIIVTSIESVGYKGYISIEAEDAINTIEPIQIKDMEGASNGKGIIAVGRHQTTEGYALYNVELPVDGEYFFWGRCYWSQVCANSFKLSVDNSTLFRYGEDPLIGQWHWVLGNSYKLQKGKHKVIIWNAEADARLDKFILTSNRNYIPSGMGNQEFLFFDFEDSLIPRNIRIDNANRWRIDYDKSNNNNALLYTWIKGMNDGEAKLSLDYLRNGYIFRFIVKTIDSNQKPQLKIKLNQVNSLSYLAVFISKNEASIVEMANGKTTNLYTYTFDKDVITTDYNDIAIQFDNNTYTIKFGSRTIFDFEYKQVINSTISLLPDSGSLLFDNIWLSAPKPAYYSENFHATGFSASEQKPELLKSYSNRLKSGKVNWYSIKGDWICTYFGKYPDGFETILGKNNKGKDALIVFGDDFWKDYNLKLAFKMNSFGETGVYFNFQDTFNYYAFTIKQLNERCYYQLKYVRNGKATILAKEDTKKLAIGYSYWHKFELLNNKGQMNAFIDDNLVVCAKDTNLKDGKIGFFTTCYNGFQVDDIMICPFSEQLNESSKRLNRTYTFAQNGNISTDFSDFVPANDSVIKHVIEVEGTYRPLVPYIIKQLFCNSFIAYKKNLFGEFNVNLETSKVAHDIEACLIFKEYNSLQICNEFKFMFLNDSVCLLKNGNVVITKSISGLERRKISIQLKNGKWLCRLMGNEIFRYIDEKICNSYKFSIGYTGIGKGKIKLENISIQSAE